jgi:hypothetical protein
MHEAFGYNLWFGSTTPWARFDSVHFAATSISNIDAKIAIYGILFNKDKILLRDHIGK